MKENLYKLSVSDWKLEFENNLIVDFVTLVKEFISSNSDGRTEIVLYECTFKTDVMELFKNKVKLISLNQKFSLVNSAAEFKEDCEYNYLNPEIKSISYIGEVDGVALFTLSINCA